MKNAMIILILSLLLSACKDNPTNLSPTYESFTANQRNVAINSYVNSYHSGLRLLSISTDTVGFDGKAAKWFYRFIDTLAGEHLTYYFHVTIDEIRFDSTTPLLVGPSVITVRWFDSDSAMVFAESYGGAQYRTQNPNATVSASLGQVLSPNAIASWRIMYQGGLTPLGLIIDADTGALLGQSK
jgi:hypothetical protein